MSENTNKIKTLGPTTGTSRDPSEFHNIDQDKIISLVTSMLIRGFREDTLPDGVTKELSDQMTALARTVGSGLKLDEEPPVAEVRTILGLMWLGQIAQAAWISQVTNDPVVAIALSEAWNASHAHMAATELTEAQIDRLDGLNGEDSVLDVLEKVANFNRTGCVCGKDHETEAQVEFSDLSPEVLMGALPDEIQEVVHTLAAMTGESPDRLVMDLRDRFLQGRQTPGEGAASILAKILNNGAPRASEPDPVVTAQGVVGFNPTDGDEAVVNKLYQQVAQKNSHLTKVQLAELKDQIRKNLPDILAGREVRIEIDLTK